MATPFAGWPGTLRKLILRLMPKGDRKSTRLNSSHSQMSYAVFCLKKKIIVLGRVAGSRGNRVAGRALWFGAGSDCGSVVRGSVGDRTICECDVGQIVLVSARVMID